MVECYRHHILGAILRDIPLTVSSSTLGEVHRTEDGASKLHDVAFPIPHLLYTFREEYSVVRIFSRAGGRPVVQAINDHNLFF